MWEDPIVNEVRKFREKHAKKCDFDLDKIFSDLKKNKHDFPQKSFHIIDGKIILMGNKHIISIV